MRSRKFFIISGFFVTWTYVVFYFMSKSTTELPVLLNGKQNKLQQLENSVQNENRKVDKLTLNLLGILIYKYFHDTDTEIRSSVSSQDKTLLSLAEPPAIREQKQPQQPQTKPEELDPVEERIVREQQEQHILEMLNILKELLKAIEAPATVRTRLANNQPVIPVVVFACNRISVKKCLDNLIKYRTNANQFPIIVSQDCGHEETRNVIESYEPNVSLIQQPDQSDILLPKEEKIYQGYYKIARHYGWALNHTFAKGYEYVIIVEDDLNVAPDFFEYFSGTHNLLKEDKSLWCVSAWNDNGKTNLIDASHPELLYRTDFFPGLGWMLTRELWQELSVKWPKSFWDDWIRHPEQRKNRVCIRPEISRTRTFGKVGVSNGLFFDKYLRYIKLSEDFVPFTKMNLSYLLKDNYDRTFLKEIYTYPVVTYDELRRDLIKTNGPVRIQYNTKNEYKSIAKMLDLMDDLKSGVPRTAYHGIVSFMHNNRRVYLAPNSNWKGYDLTWSKQNFFFVSLLF